MVRDFAASVWDTLSDIASAGFAAPSQIDGKWGVVIDEDKTVPIQHFTPRNSWDFSFERTYPDKPNGWRIRFVNEANSYHDFCQALFAASGTEAPAKAFLIVDKPFLSRFGLGFVKPFPVPVGPNIRSGYLKAGRSITELARAAGIDPAGLETTIAAWNADMATGEDRAFGKGSTAYNRFNGDPEFQPNPCLAPIATGPFYAVEVVVGDLGTFAGLRADQHSRVIDDHGRPIPGLYAAGNDMASIMGGNYPGGGITLGPALTFGYIAAKHLAERDAERDTAAA